MSDSNEKILGESPLLTPSIQWFPGHMAKTRRLMSENLKLVDIIIEMLDARIPAASRNPEIDKLVGEKPRMILLNKADAADETMTRNWLAHYEKQGLFTLAADCRSGRGLKNFEPIVRETLSELLARRAAKGMSGQSIRMMIVGIPNVGKSSLINRLAGKKSTKVEDRPGVTRGRQWVSVARGIDLLDMPGVLWPKFEDPAVGERLAFTGAVKDNVIDLELLSMRLLWLLRQRYPQSLDTRYQIAPDESGKLNAGELLELVGRRRGMLLPGGRVNTERAAITVMDEFRSGKLGRITLETPPENV